MANLRADLGMTLYEAEAEFRRSFIEMVLRAQGGNRCRAAQTLGIGRTYLQRLIREHGINVPPVTGRPKS